MQKKTRTVASPHRYHGVPIESFEIVHVNGVNAIDSITLANGVKLKPRVVDGGDEPVVDLLVVPPEQYVKRPQTKRCSWCMR